jgi:hypothetical protein
MQSVTIELGDADGATSLRSFLRAEGLTADLGADGAHRVAVDLIATVPEQRIETVLSAVDAWLSRSGNGSVTVHLDGSSYLLGPADG